MTEILKIKDIIEYNSRLYCFEAQIEVLEEEFGKISKTFVKDMTLYEVRKTITMNPEIEKLDAVGIEYKGDLVHVGEVLKINGDFACVQIVGTFDNVWFRKTDLVQVKCADEDYDESVISEIISEFGVDLGE
jgi:hypothetical protein